MKRTAIRNMKKAAAISILFTLGVTVLSAQDLDNNIVDVVGHHTVIIRDAEKMNLRPEIDDTANVVRPVEISIQPTGYTVEFNPREIKPAKLGSKSDIPLKKGHAILGFGNYTTPYGELFYNTGRSRTHQSGLHIRHLSSSGDIDGYGDAAFSQNAISLYTHHYTRHADFKGKVSYDRNMVHFYGFEPDSFQTIDFAEVDTRQVFHMANGEFGVNNLGDHTKLYYDLHTRYGYLHSLDTMREHLIHTDLTLFSEPDLVRAAKRQELGITISHQFRHSALDTTVMRRNHLVAFKPYYKGIVDEFDIRAGFQLWLEMEADSSSSFRLFPDIEVSLNLIPGTISLYAALSGGIHSHTYTAYSSENPFIARDLDFANSVEKLKLEGGLKVALGRKIDGVVHLELANYASMPFFVNDTSTFMQNRFVVVEDEEISVSKIGVELGYRTTEKLKIRNRMYFYGYSMTNLPDPWHKPRFEWNTSLSYNLRDKILANIEFTYLSGIVARTFDAAGVETSTTLDPVIDINLMLEYRFNKAFSVFLQGNNLLGQHQYMWYNYPSQAIRVLGGISYSM